MSQRKADAAVEAEERPRLAWAMPTLARSFYFQPFFREMARVFPRSVIFTGLWPGYADGYEGTFEVRLLDGVRHVKYGRDPMGYGRTFLWVPPTFMLRLLRFRPDVVLVGGFSIALVHAIVVRLFTRCRIMLLWDGNAPYATFGRESMRGRARQVLGRFVDGAVSNTVDGARYLRDEVGLRADRVSTVIYQVADAQALTSRPVSLGPMEHAVRPLFLYVGRLVPGKAVHHLLEAAGILQRKGLAFSLGIVGSGPEEPRLRRLASDLGLEDRIAWMGERTYGELGTFFQACDVFVLPSLLEVRPMVVSEAMCFGKPVVVTSKSDLLEIVRHGENGFLFDPAKPEELAAYMEQFIVSPDLVARCGARSAELIRPHTAVAAAHDVAVVVRQVIDAQGRR